MIRAKMTEGMERWDRIEVAMDEAESIIQAAFEESYGTSGPETIGMFEEFCEVIFAQIGGAQADWEEWQG